MGTKWMRWLMVVQLVMWLATGCGGGGGGGGATTRALTPDQVAAVTVTPTTPVIANGTTVRLQAVASYGNGTSSDITLSATWSSSDASIAVVNSSGLVTAIAPGTVTISATTAGVSGTATVTVTDVALLDIVITPDLTTLPLGASQQLGATGHFSDGTVQDVTTAVAWNAGDGTVATISPQGILSAVGAGTVTIVASLQGVSASFDLEVPATASVSLASLLVAPDSLQLAPGQVRQFAATAVYSNGAAYDASAQVTWNSANSAVAAVDAAGLVTAGTAAGTTQIGATLDGISGSATVTNSAATLQGITIAPGSATLPLGIAQAFTATGAFSDGTSSDITASVTWSSDAPTIAWVLNGKVTAQGVGAANISASLGGLSAHAPVTVTDATLQGLTVLPDSPSVGVGAVQPFSVTGTWSDGSSWPVTSGVVWQTSDATVASIDANGVATGVATGSAQITAIVGTVAGNTTVTVVPAILSGITVTATPGASTLPAGETLQLSATANYVGGASVDVTGQAVWISANPALAVVQADGTVTGVAAGGPVAITASFGGQTGSLPLTVTAAQLTALAITPTSVALPAGLGRQLSATGTYSDASTFNLTGSVIWSSDDTSVATVDANGMLTAVASGNTLVNATAGGVEVAIPVTVTTATLQSLSVSPGNKSMALGNTLQYAAAGHYSDGTTWDLTRQVTWSSGNAAVASVASSGLATAVGVGTTTIKAAFGTVAGSASLTVTGPTLSSITVTPASATVMVKGTQQLRAIGTYSDGSTRDLTAAVKWTSSSNGIATVYRGLVTGVAPGQATISAAVKNKRSSAVVTVTR